MANRPVTITGINEDGTLILTNNGNVSANPSDTVTWLIGANSGVRSIDAVVDKSLPTDVFNPDPSLQPDSSSWQGTINPAISSAISETYIINYTDDNGVARRFDPVIQVNPK